MPQHVKVPSRLRTVKDAVPAPAKAAGRQLLRTWGVRTAARRPLPDFLVIGAYPERADARDVLVTRSGGGRLESLASGSVVGTDSPRRAGFILSRRPDLGHRPLHGNVDTRLRKLDGGEVDALVLHLTQLGLLAPAAGQRRGRAPRAGFPPVGITTIPLPLPCDAASPGFRFSTGRTTTGALDPDPGPHGV